MVSLYIYGKTKNGNFAEVYVCDFDNATLAYNFVYKHKIRGGLLYDKGGHYLRKDSVALKRIEKYF